MKNIKLDIKDIVKNNLNNKRNELFETYFDEVDYYDTDKLIKTHVEKTIHLLNEGYELNELNPYIEKAGDAVKSMTNQNIDYGELFKGSMYSMAKEFAIKWLLDFFGFKPSISTYVAQAMADLTIKDILYPFKNREYCQRHLPNLLDAILEILARKIGHSLFTRITGQSKIDKATSEKEKAYKKALKDYETDLLKYKKGELENVPDKPTKYEPRYSKHSYEWGDVLQIGLGNVAGELIRKTQTSEGIANFICPKLHKK